MNIRFWNYENFRRIIAVNTVSARACNIAGKIISVANIGWTFLLLHVSEALMTVESAIHTVRKGFQE
jgi:hypothetical protein